jgi:hypothetical protein
MRQLIIIFCFAQISFAEMRLEELPPIHGEKAKVYKVSDNARALGHSLWLNKKFFKAKYFSDKMNYSSVFERHNAWKKDKALISICSAAFVNNGKPIGIAIDEGKKINGKADYRMDALVIAHNEGEKAGDIEVSDLSKGNMRKMEKDYYNFLNQAEKERASVFQTQLLIYENRLRVSNNSRKHAERRLLALARDKNGDELHIIFNIARPITLYDISKNISDYFKKTETRIIALLNLDTGANDFMQVYNETGEIAPNFKGSRKISEITDMIIYYIDKK